MPGHARGGTNIQQSSPNVHDYFAAGIFWLYILAALFFSAVAIYTIATSSVKSLPNDATRYQQTWILSMAAVVSFTILSINMLNILIQSFTAWNMEGLVEWSHPRRWLPGIWAWSLETKPFVKFVDDISADPLASRWSLTALVATFVMHVYIGLQGEQSSA